MTTQVRTDEVAELQRVGVADAMTAAGLRHDLERWLGQAISTPIDAAVRADIILTAAEALANSAEHAYSEASPHAVITLHARYEPSSGCVTVCVGDRGRWKQRASDPTSTRGRGLLLMQRLSAECRIDRRADGTTVCMDHRAT